MDSADSRWILPLCVYVHLHMRATHARLRFGPSCLSHTPLLLMLEPCHVASRGSRCERRGKGMSCMSLSISFDVSVMSGKLITQI